MADTTDMIHRAIDLSEDEDYTGAIKLLNEAITIDSTNAQAFFERGMALLNLDQDADAVEDFGHTLQLDPDFPGARDWRARALESLGNHQLAATDRLEELRRRPDGPHAGMGVCPQDWAECAEAFVAAGDPTTARSLLEEYFAGPVGSVTKYQRYATAPMRVLARLQLRSGELDSALDTAADAARHEHSCPADHELYGIVLASCGRVAEAEDIYREHTKGLPPGVAYMEDLKAAIARQNE